MNSVSTFLLVLFRLINDAFYSFVAMKFLGGWIGKRLLIFVLKCLQLKVRLKCRNRRSNWDRNHVYKQITDK